MAVSDTARFNKIMAALIASKVHYTFALKRGADVSEREEAKARLREAVDALDALAAIRARLKHLEERER